MVLSATPHNSAPAAVEGIGRGVLGDEVEWKDGGGEDGMERIDGAA